MNGLDRQIFYWFNRLPESGFDFLVFFSDGIHHWPLRIALGVVAIVMISLGGRHRSCILLSFLAWPLANGMTDLLKQGLQWPRPCVELNDVILHAGKLESYGTASAHSANMAAIAAVWTAYMGWRYGTIWILIALLTGFSRVYVGVHYPSQVLLGWTCGIIAGLVIVFLANKILPKPANVVLHRDADES